MSTRIMKVKEIHGSSLYGIVIETGCGAPVVNELCYIEGASTTFAWGDQPYSKHRERRLYGNSTSFTRSVSKEFCSAMVRTELEHIPITSDINFIFTTSWQLGSDENHLTHGYYGIHLKGLPHIWHLHLTLRKDFVGDRKAKIQAIGELGIDMLHSLIKGNLDEFSYCDTPFIIDEAYIEDIKSNTIKVDHEYLILALERNKRDYFLVFQKDDVMRFEELTRQGEEFIIQKGSFNPIHHKHVDMMDLSLQKYPHARPVFLISTNRFDKPHIDPSEVRERIKHITERGYSLIICKEIFYYKTFDMLLEWSNKSKKFYFPLGTDTINRIMDVDVMEAVIVRDLVEKYKTRFKFLVFPRMGYTANTEYVKYQELSEDIPNYIDDGTSSTGIREGRMDNRI